MISNAHALTKAVEVLRICGFSSRRHPVLPAPALLLAWACCAAFSPSRSSGSSIALRDRFSVSAFWDDVRDHGATVGHCVFSIPKMLEQAPPNDRRRATTRCAACSTPSTTRSSRQRFGVQLHRELRAHRGGQRDLQPARRACGARLVRAGLRRLGGPPGRPRRRRGARSARPARSCCARASRRGSCSATSTSPRRPPRPSATCGSTPATSPAATQTGFYFYQGRNKDVIRRRGQNISAWEVEQILLSHPERRRRRGAGAPLRGRRGRPPRRARGAAKGAHRSTWPRSPPSASDGCRRSWCRGSSSRSTSCRRRRAAGSRSTSWRATLAAGALRPRRRWTARRQAPRVELSRPGQALRRRLEDPVLLAARRRPGTGSATTSTRSRLSSAATYPSKHPASKASVYMPFCGLLLAEVDALRSPHDASRVVVLGEQRGRVLRAADRVHEVLVQRHHPRLAAAARAPGP